MYLKENCKMGELKLEIGVRHELKIDQESSTGWILKHPESEEFVLLLKEEVLGANLEVGDDLELFVYKDGDGSLRGTTIEPLIELGEFAYLEVKDANLNGAFLDWGLPKDILVPFKEQEQRMEEGRRYVVHLYFDELSERLVATSRVNKFLEQEEIDLEMNQEVDLLVWERNPLGFQVIIDNKYKGLIYTDSIFKTIKIGDQIKGYIRQVREDKKVDVVLQKQGFVNIEPNAKLILEKLEASPDKSLPFSDKSDPDKIRKHFGMSKKTFKKAIGTLYKQRLIRVEPKAIYLANS